jgi:tRNA dimethylallyltransferase
VIRAIERSRAGTDTWSLEPRYRVLRLGLTAPRPALYARIDRRVDEQIAAGLVEEVRRLLAAGHAPSAPAMTGIGYRQIVAYLEGRRTLAEAIADLEHATHRYARQQYTWFRLDDPRIHWFDVEAPMPCGCAAHS